MDKDNNQTLKVRQTRAFKLKDKEGRGGIRFNLMNVFGFKPEEIVIQKVHGSNNTFVLNAILTPEELKKEQIEQRKTPKLSSKISQREEVKNHGEK